MTSRRAEDEEDDDVEEDEEEDPVRGGRRRERAGAQDEGVDPGEREAEREPDAEEDPVVARPRRLHGADPSAVQKKTGDRRQPVVVRVGTKPRAIPVP